MERFFTENEMLHVLPSPYRPNLALSDFWLFGHMEIGLAYPRFAEPDELFEAVLEFLEKIPADALTAVFEGWINRVR
jgi:hypothetical protein